MPRKVARRIARHHVAIAHRAARHVGLPHHRPMKHAGKTKGAAGKKTKWAA